MTTNQAASNIIVREEFGLLHEMFALRDAMMNVLNDADLSFALTGNPPLGVVIREMGEMELIYINSFKTFNLDWGYRRELPADLDTNLDKLRVWLKELDAEYEQTLAALTDDEINTRTIKRDEDFNANLRQQFHIYREALLIFYGRATVYMKALDKLPSEQWRYWVAW